MPLLRRKGLFESNRVQFLPISSISPNFFSMSPFEVIGAMPHSFAACKCRGFMSLKVRW